MFIYYNVLLYIMVYVNVDLSEKSNRNLKVYMANNNILDKRIAINKILENVKLPIDKQ